MDDHELAETTARLYAEWDRDAIPEHMRGEAEFYGHWSPQFYDEAQCENCDEPAYRYKMDLVVEWKHFNHATYCSILRAKPKPSL